MLNSLLYLTFLAVLPDAGFAWSLHSSKSTSPQASTSRFLKTSEIARPATANDIDGTAGPIQIVESMPEPLPENLINQYYLLRHGQSTANVDGIISSSRSLAYSDKHGLTPLGYEQGRASAGDLLQAIRDMNTDDKKIVFISSPFARARQTAQACLDGLLDEKKEEAEQMELEIPNTVVLKDKLMERFFGRLDNEAIYTYAYVWPVDSMDVTHTAFDVESVASVCTRIRELIQELESEYEGHHLVLVSHADVLQITQLYAASAPNVGTFSSYRFVNGEVRAMQRNTDSLPEPCPLEAPVRVTRTS